MSRLSTCTIALAASAAAFAAGAGGAAAESHRSCATRGKTVVANGKARVYKVRRSGGRRLYFGCVGGHKPHWLGSRVPENAVDVTEAVGQVQLNGRRVTYERRRCGPADGTFGCRHAVRTVDARTGALLFHDTERGAGFVIVAASDGSFATASNFGIAPDQRVSYTGPNGTVELDHASGQGRGNPDQIDIQSLAIGGDTIYWTRHGQPRSAPIPGSRPGS